MRLRRLARWAAALLALAAVALVLRAALIESRQVAPGPARDLAFDPRAAAERLAEALRFATIAGREPGATDAAPFESFGAWIDASYPRVRTELELELLGPEHERFARLYTWRGSDAALAPVLLLAHQDVVPAGGDGSTWTHPPFAGAIDGGYVWGRGALDDKGALVAILEAAEALLGEGFAPRRTVYLAFGHDEEVGSARGAARIAASLAERGARLAWVLDEGQAVAVDMLPGLAAPAALIGVAEKRAEYLQLVAGHPGGHSSLPTPPGESAASVLARGLARLAQDPMPAGIDGAVEDTLAWLAPELGFPARVIAANADLLEPLLVAALERQPGPNALLRTTIVPTLLDAGVERNVLPPEARAVLSVRLHPRDSIEDATAHVRRAVDGLAIEVRAFGEREDGPAGELADPRAPRIASSAGPGFRAIAGAIQAVAPDVVVAPSLVTGATDASLFEALADDVYRFTPWRIQAGDVPRVHGADERVSLAGVEEAVRFYAEILRRAQE